MEQAIGRTTVEDTNEPAAFGVAWAQSWPARPLPAH